MAKQTELIFMVDEAPEGGYAARALGASIFSQAETLEELRKNVLDAVRCHYSQGDLPSVVRLHLVKDEILQV